METIQQIRSLRKENHNPRLSTAILKSIETIKQTVQASLDQNGWKKVDWRSSRPSGSSQSSQSSHSSHSSYSARPSSQNHQYSRPESSRQESSRQESSRGGNAWGNPNGSYTTRSQSQSNQNQNQNPFHHRNKPSYTPREPARDPPPSIPLTYTTTTSSPLPEVEQGFEVVRRGRGKGFHSDGNHAPTVEFRSPPQKYVSKFKRTAEKVEDTILNTILLGKLNKFSAANYSDIKEFIIQIIDSGQTDMITCFMKLVFEKAASEEIFCPLYAKLLSELSEQYPILLQEMASLYTHYMSIFVEVAEEPNKTHQEFCQRNIEKKYRRGYSQFLAELTKHNVIDTAVFVQTILKIVEQIEYNQSNTNAVKLVEELADCLVRMMKAIQSDMIRQETDEKEEESSSDHKMKIKQIGSTLKENVAKRIQSLTVRHPEAVGVSNKARFTFMNIYDDIKKYDI